MIRAATIDDTQALLELGRRMLEEAPNFRALPFSASRLEATLLRLIGDDEALVTVAERDGIVIGALIAIASVHWASEVAVVSELAFFVVPEARGALVALGLIARLKEFTLECGAKLCRAGSSTGVDNALVVRLYERAGFVMSGAVLQFSPSAE